MGKQGLKTAVREATQEVGERLAREIGKGAASKSIRSTLIRQGGEALVRRGVPLILRVGDVARTLAQKATLDITPLVRQSFKSSRLGRESYRLLTGLEARVFMRGDRRVLISLPDLLVGKNRVASFLRVTAANAGADAALETEAVQAAIRRVMRLLRRWDEMLDERARQELNARRNLSACFWASAAGEWEKMQETKETAR